jgi:general secretion pathway protein K
MGFISNRHISRKALLLALSLWMMIFLSVFAVYLGIGARQKMLILKRITERDALRCIARAGIKKAILEIAYDVSDTVDGYAEQWASGGTLFKDVAAGMGSYSLFVSYPQKDVPPAYGIIDEARKINVNTAERKILQRLFESLGVSSDDSAKIAASIIDFRDEDSELSMPIGSAEDGYYRNLREPYACKDAPFEALDELLLVKGITQDIFEKAEDFVTIYSAGAVNINTARPEVLYSLGMGKRLVDKIEMFRVGDDKKPGTLDDTMFTAASSITAQLSQKYSLGIDEATILTNLIAANLLTTFSSHFSVKSRAALAYSKNTYEINCVFDRAGTIFYWREQ